MFDDEKQKDGAEEQIIGLFEVAGPDFRRMIGQKGGPVLPVVSWR